jgi:DNA-binding transcriptional ArsR family regulator
MGLASTGLDDVFQALGDSTRRELLSVLAEGEQTTTALAEPFALSRPAISKHLKVLLDAGLVRRRRRGRHQVYTLSAGPLGEASDWLLTYRAFWRASLSALEAHLESRRGE